MSLSPRRKPEIAGFVNDVGRPLALFKTLRLLYLWRQTGLLPTYRVIDERTCRTCGIVIDKGNPNCSDGSLFQC